MISHPMAFRAAIYGTKSVWVITMLYRSSIVYSFSKSKIFSQLLASGLNWPTKNISSKEPKFINISWSTIADRANVIKNARAILLPN